MARWIDQTLKVNTRAEIQICCDYVWIGSPGETWYSGAFLEPKTRDDANGMAIALRLAAKRLEDIGKGLR